MEFIDITGQPKSEDDLREALQAVEHTMLKDILKVPPRLAVLLPTIRQALVELLKRREIEE